MASTFNDTVINQIVSYLHDVLQKVSNRDQLGRVLRLDEVTVDDTEQQSIADLINNGGTDCYVLKLVINSYLDEKITDRHECMLEIPRMNNNVFIIDGKYRIATAVLGKDYRCRVYRKNIVIDDLRVIEWNYPKGSDWSQFNPQYFKMIIRDWDFGENLIIDIYQENLDKYRDLLKLDEYCINKLKVKLDRDDIPEYITTDLIKELYLSGPDSKKDNIIDQSIITVENDLIHHLNLWNNKKTVVREIAGQWWRNGLIYLTSIQNAIKRYFRTAQTKYIEIPSNVNPLVYDSLKYKIVLPNFTAFNATFADLIDASNTPENTNVNIINELNVCTSVEDGQIFYSCYDYKTKKPVKIDYIEYLTKKVLKCDCFDYDKMDVRQCSVYKYTLRQKVYETDKLIDFDLIEPKPDDRLSLTARRIPLINMSDSVRVSMGCAMSKQAIQTEGCEPRLVDSGNDDTDVAQSSNLIRYKGAAGKVVDIHENKIFVKDANGIVTETTIPAASTGASQTIITSEPLVKVGDDVIPNQVVASPTIMRSGTYNLGRNANAVYMNYLGLTYEDGVVISQSYAEKMTHYTMIEITKCLRPGDILREIAIIGKRVKSKDFLVANDSRLQVSDAVDDAMAARSTVIDVVNPRTNKNNLVVPNNIDEGYIVDVKITKNPRPTDVKGESRTISISDYTLKVLDDYIRENKRSDDYLVLPEKYRNIKLGDFSDFKGIDDVAISFKIVVRHPMVIGDKSTNSYGSKGIISLVLPDDCMPRLDTDGKGNGPIFDIIMNPAAVVSRKNASQLYECLLTKCIHEIYATLSQQLKIGGLDGEKNLQIWKKWTQEFYGDKFMDMTEDEFKEACKDINNFKMKVGSFAKISYEQVLHWADLLDVSETQNIYCPDVVIYEGPDGRMACSPEYAKEHDIHGKLHELGFVENPVVTGYSYMYKLYKSAKMEGKVTPDDMSSGAPLLGRGLYRDSGQKIGEMELWALQSAGATKMVTHNNPDIERGENLLINQLLLTGFVLRGKNGLPFNTEFEYKAKQLKDKMEGK